MDCRVLARKMIFVQDIVYRLNPLKVFWEQSRRGICRTHIPAMADKQAETEIGLQLSNTST